MCVVKGESQDTIRRVSNKEIRDMIATSELTQSGVQCFKNSICFKEFECEIT